MSKITNEPNNAEDIAGKILALMAKDPDSRAVHDFMQYACAVLNLTGERLLTASMEIAKKSEGKPHEAESLPEITIGYEELRECLEDKIKSMCARLPDGMTMEQLVAGFAEYCRSDVYEWLKDNLKSFVERYDFPSKYDVED